MPPRTRTRVTKLLKENIEVVKKTKLKSNEKVTKPPRKALADKTNSLSDDNASIDIPIKTFKTALKSNVDKTNIENDVRPRRDRRVPSRYVESNLLKNLSNSKESPLKVSVTSKDEIASKKASRDKITDVELSTQEEELKLVETRPKRNCRLQSVKESVTKPDSKSLDIPSPFKTPSKDLESSLVANRPKRIHRLPSRFDDHSISPNKFIPVQPCHASTPIVQKNLKTVAKDVQSNTTLKQTAKTSNTDAKNSHSAKKPTSKVIQKSKLPKNNAIEQSSISSIDKGSPDTNNNGRVKATRAKKAIVEKKLQNKQVSLKTNESIPFSKRLLDKSLSFRVLDDKKQSKGKDDNLDVYEFTYDPNEEPAPKKKRKRVVKKKPPKPKEPKIIVLKSNYNENLSKALETLKSKVKPSQLQTVQNNVKPAEEAQNTHKTVVKPVTNHITPAKPNQSVTYTPIAKDNQSVAYTPVPVLPVNESAKNSIHESNYVSIRVEDIAANFEPSDNHDDINYSPVNSPNNRPKTPVESNDSHISAVHHKDPLNLQEDLSFFDEQPVASSSMNVSVRHPLASPWRVEFSSLPIKWHANTYVKPNMTPAVESSFINSEETTKTKHVYTNMIPQDSEPLPQIIEPDTPNLVQPSIISFMREVAERSAKKKRERSLSPTKANSIFDDVTNTGNGHKTPTKKARKTTKDSTPNTSNNSNNKSNDNESSNQSNKQPETPLKKKKDNDCTFFGFDDSENVDQENISPAKNIPNARRGLRSRPVLQEFNAQNGPTRAAMPVGTKSKLTSSEVVNQLYDQLKSAEDASQFPGKESVKEPDNTMTTNVEDPSWREDDDSQSVHLFEDIEVVHHLKPHRKSYGKAKKVTFRQPSNSDISDTVNDEEPANCSDEDDLADLTFQMPNVKEKRVAKKKKAKKQLSKKEEKEVEEWAAGFNSMCEDVEDFPLMVE